MGDERVSKVSENHRTRVAAERRERMRARLVEGALLVFGQVGLNASVINELIRTAGVSRGSFYNYFRTNEDLLLAVSVALSNDMMRIVDPLAHAEADPAARIALGVRMILELAQAHPSLCAFMSRGGMRVLAENSLIMKYLPRDLANGQSSGRLRIKDFDLALDIVVGPTLAAVYRIQQGAIPGGYVTELAAAILRALGLEDEEAEAIASGPLPAIVLPPDSLLARNSSARSDGARVPKGGR